MTLTAVRHPDVIDSGAPFSVELELDVTRPLDRPIVALSFSTQTGQVVVGNVSATDGADLRLEMGRNRLTVTYDDLPLTRGTYSINVVVADGTINNQLLAAMKKSEFEVRVPRGDLGAGVLQLRPEWIASTTSMLAQ